MPSPFEISFQHSAFSYQLEKRALIELIADG